MARRGASSSNGDEAAKKNYSEVIEEMNLTPLQKDALRARWLDQRNYASKESARNKRWHVRFRLIAIIGGVIVPAMIALNPDGSAAEVIRWTVFGISLLVAISVAVEEFFSFNEHWLRNRRTTDLLKAEFWQFVQRAGHYDDLGTHRQCYDEFASRVEQIIQMDSRAFFTNEMARQSKDGQQGVGGDAGLSFDIDAEVEDEEDVAYAAGDEVAGADMAFDLEVEAEVEETDETDEDE